MQIEYPSGNFTSMKLPTCLTLPYNDDSILELHAFDTFLM